MELFQAEQNKWPEYKTSFVAVVGTVISCKISKLLPARDDEETPKRFHAFRMIFFLHFIDQLSYMPMHILFLTHFIN